MIFHASIPADDPERVARVMAELWRAEYFPFVYPQSYIVIAGDGRGTEIEVQKRGNEQVPADVDVGLRHNTSASPYSEVHLNVLTPLNEREVLAVAAREGWIARVCDRRFFNLIEFWIENKFMLELMTATEAERYKAFMTASNWRKIVAETPMPLPQFGFAEAWLTESATSEKR